jgi:hypothetical protein
MHKSTYFITSVRFIRLLEKRFWHEILYKLYVKAHASQLFTKRSYVCTPKALLAEAFKSCKTLKQENTSQETAKGVLIKEWRKFNRQNFRKRYIMN